MIAAETVQAPAPAKPKRAIVLSGGGARGAYEAGVLRFILDDLPKRTGVKPDVGCDPADALQMARLAATREVFGETEEGERLHAKIEQSQAD